MAQIKGHIGPRQGRAPQDLLSVTQLCFRGTQELPPGRGVEEKVADLDRGAAGPGGPVGRENPPPFHRHPHPALGWIGAGHEDEPRDRRDRRQGLTAKTEGRDVVELVGRPDLGSRVPFESEHRVVGIHTAAVVRDPHQAATAVDQVDLDPRRLSVEAVFHQLLDHRRGSLHHLTGGDAVDQTIGEDVNAGHEGHDTGTRCQRATDPGE